MAKQEYESDMQPLQIRSYNNAFDLQFLGESAKSFIIDWLSLTLAIELVMLLLGYIPIVQTFYQWLWDQQFYIVQYVIFPVAAPFAIIKLTKRDGVGFWRWIIILTMEKLSRDRFTPFDEGNVLEQVQANLRGEED
ncbi:hypothetical protein SAMN05444392_105178 [Seinonella peptonophila]|uniref:TcpE family protein n=1 Tax=Seinonella peptonophila TaxID=112248 RepID=A0A1M4XTV4_9BACL|nr:hypothetical protein [Seinonella peptonophila]SHE96875.1 hypothetical protein SAMN05444392_105178 [Seinonella peptonophila]